MGDQRQMIIDKIERAVFLAAPQDSLKQLDHAILVDHDVFSIGTRQGFALLVEHQNLVLALVHDLEITAHRPFKNIPAAATLVDRVAQGRNRLQVDLMARQIEYIFLRLNVFVKRSDRQPAGLGDFTRRGTMKTFFGE